MFVHDDQKDPKCGHARYSSRYPQTSKPEKINPGQLKYFCKRFHISPKGCKRISGRTQDDATLLKVAQSPFYDVDSYRHDMFKRAQKAFSLVKSFIEESKDKNEF